MCGIGCCLVQKESDKIVSSIIQQVADSISPRGPDGSSTFAVTPTFTLLASVLALRGHKVSHQPRVATSNGSALCWNGEVFGGQIQVQIGASDTDAVFDELCKVSDKALSSSESVPAAICKSLSGVLGPYAFIFWHAPSSTLCFGRDPFGRRSLLLHSCSKNLTVSSTYPNSLACCDDSLFEEIPPRGIYASRFNLSSQGDLSSGIFGLPEPLKERVCPIQIELFEWSSLSPHFAGVSPLVLKGGESFPIATSGLLSRAALLLLKRLSESVRVRVTTIEPNSSTCNPTDPTVSILFSGGLDSMILAALAHRHLPRDQPIDLLNVCFSPERDSPDRAAAISGLSELEAACPGRKWNLVLVNDSFSGAILRGKALVDVLTPAKTHMDFNIGSALWSASRGDGYLADSSIAHEALQARNKHVRYGLSSRGSASGSQSSLSAFNSQVTSPNDVNELAFDSINNLVSCEEIDRILTPQVNHYLYLNGEEISKAFVTGDCELNSLCNEYLKEINSENSSLVSPSGTSSSVIGKSSKEEKSEVRPCNGSRKGQRCKGGASALCSSSFCKKCCLLSDLACQVHKKIPVDLPNSSITSSEIHESDYNQRPYVSNCRVVLVGIGADELMGGYGRHRTAFFAPENGGWKTLRESLDSDIDRIWIRNLGRDDRVIGSLGKESRHPFLDEAVVALLRALPLPLIVEPRLPHGVGDKQILRAVASLLGLRAASVRVKRAMHFGCRIAKQANIASFGSVSKANGCGQTGFDLESLLLKDSVDETD
jgi:asparagine synthetase B (glutamine-hydrolysing)